MGLDNFNTVLQLNTHLERYLRGAVNYNTLRGHVLANLPLSNIVSEIHSELDALASADNHKAKFDLTEQAHQKQIDEDEGQARLDERTKSSNIDVIAQLTAKIAQIDSEERANNVTLSSHEAALSLQLRRLNHTKSEIRELSAQIQRAHRIESPHVVVTGHSIPHPSEARGGIHHPQPVGHMHVPASSDSVHPAPHQHDNHLAHHELRMAALTATERELESLVQGIRLLVNSSQSKRDELQQSRRLNQSRLESTCKAQQDIEMRASEREQRRTVRATSPGSLSALSLSNRGLLEQTIGAANAATGRLCIELKRAVSEQCYAAFLNQLEIRICRIITLQPSEENALKQIIACMREYLRESSNLERHVTELRSLESELQRLIGEQGTSSASVLRLQQRNRTLEANNTTLATEIGALQQQKDEFVIQRNQYALYTLVGSLLSSAATATYFLTQASIITLPPLALIIAASLTVAALLVTFVVSCVAGIRGYIRQSEIDTKSETIEQNNRQIDRNNATIRSLQQRAPELEGSIEAKQLQIARQREITQAVEKNANGLLRSANEVRVGVEADPSASAGVSFSQFQSQTFFGDARGDGEAPPPYEKEVNGSLAAS